MISLHCLVASLVLLQAGVSSGFSPVSPNNHQILFSSPYYPSSPSSRRNTIHTMATSNNEKPLPDESSSPINMSSLRKRMSRQESQYTNLFMEQTKYQTAFVEGGERQVPESVHIILFHPDTEKQHVHTIEFPKDSGNNLILAFESRGDCGSFAGMLMDLEFVDPSPVETIFEPLAEYCDMSGLALMIVPKGFELTPPQMNANDDNNNEGGLVDDDDEDSSTIVEDYMVVENDDDELGAWG